MAATTDPGRSVSALSCLALQHHAAADIVTEYLKISIIPFSNLQHNSRGHYLPPRISLPPSFIYLDLLDVFSLSSMEISVQ